MAQLGIVQSLRATGRHRVQEMSKSIQPTMIDPKIRDNDVIILHLNDLTDSTDWNFISIVRTIIKYRKLCVFTVSGWDNDPRPISEIPEAKQVFRIAATKYGILAVIENKIKLGLLPDQIAPSVLQQEIDEFVACCIGKYRYHAELGKSVFEIDLDEKQRLIESSRKVYRELYHDLI
jgi:hypothetical protein